MKRILTGVLLAGLLLSSCNKDETLYYNITEMGVVQNGKIISDSGMTYTIVESSGQFDLTSLDRILFYCDVLRANGENAYEIRLNNLYPIQKLDIVPAAGLPEQQPDHPVYVNAAWFGGGFLNLNLNFFTKDGSKVEHKFTLAAGEIPTAAGDTLRLRLYHDAADEYWDGSVELSGTGYVSNGTYVSFPLSDYLPASGTRPLKITYLWHTYEDGYIVSPTKEYAIKGDLVR